MDNTPSAHLASPAPSGSDCFSAFLPKCLRISKNVFVLWSALSQHWEKCCLFRVFMCLFVCLFIYVFIHLLMCLFIHSFGWVRFVAGWCLSDKNMIMWKGTCEDRSLLFVGCLTSQQHASVSQGRICSDKFTRCHTEIEVADPTFHLTQSQYTDTGPTSPSTDPIAPGAWQGSHWSANFEVAGMTRPQKKIPWRVGFEPGIFHCRGGRLNH